jgi:hypothetical protein
MSNPYASYPDVKKHHPTGCFIGEFDNLANFEQICAGIKKKVEFNHWSHLTGVRRHANRCNRTLVFSHGFSGG